MKKSVNLHFNSMHRGPGRVVENLAHGLVMLGYDVYANSTPNADSYQSCLQPTRMLEKMPSDTLMGPNLFVLPDEWGDFCRFFNHFVTPSDWVTSIYKKYDNLSHATVESWPVGIDTNLWSPIICKQDRVLVYFKNREENDLLILLQNLEKIGQEYEVLRYGSYEEKDLRAALARTTACILLTGTESQGVAYMQILSSNKPCYVINSCQFNYNGVIAPATSVPYFDTRCGIIEERFDESRWHEFKENLAAYKPCEFILENFTLDKCAQNFIDIVKKYQ